MSIPVTIAVVIAGVVFVVWLSYAWSEHDRDDHYDDAGEDYHDDCDPNGRPT